MKAVRTDQSDVTLTLPGGTVDNDLPAQRALLYNAELGQTERDAQLGFISVWQPTDEEARRLDAGGCVELTVWGIPTPSGEKTMPPVSVGVTEGVVPEREIIPRGHVDRALGHLYGELKERAERAIAEHGAETLGLSVADVLPEPGDMADLWANAVAETQPRPDAAGYVDPDDPAERAKLDANPEG